MHELLLRVLESFEHEAIPYCVLRDGERMQEFDNGGEVDLLVPETHFEQLLVLLSQLGYTKLSAWGHSPHHFFITYHKASDSWIKLDVVTRVTYGKPIPTMHTSLADNCIEHRRRLGLVYMPSAEDEFMTLLLHCMLDKGYFAQHRGARLKELCHQIDDEAYISQLLRQYWIQDSNWSLLSAQVNAGAWDVLLAQREVVAKQLKQREPGAALARHIRGRLLRKAQRGIGYVLPRTPSVALLAPDGAGKSTLAEGLGKNFYFPVRMLYMGLYQKKSSKVGRKKVKGLGIAQNLIKQWRRYLISRHYRASGKLVIFDRYSYDALLSSPQQRSNSGKLRQFRRWLLANSCPPPDLILFLDAPGELLFSRKGERNPVDLEVQRQQYLQLQASLPQMVVVDATRGAENVRREATDLIWKKHSQRSGRRVQN